jgi:COP9 signalosome complex subunit 6
MSSSIYLHPLVIANVCDHFTREKLRKNSLAIGALVGIQDGSNVQLLDATEMKMNYQTLVADLALLKRKIDLITRVFPKYEFLGWYVVGKRPNDIEMFSVQKQLQSLNESLLVLMMDDFTSTKVVSTSTLSTKKRLLPLAIYETITMIVNDTPLQSFVEVPTQIETTDSERLVMDHINATMLQKGEEDVGFSSSLLALKNGIAKLTERVVLLHKFLKLQQTNPTPDHALLIEAMTACNMLPALDLALIQADFQSQWSETLLVSLIASITKQTNAASIVLEKFNIAIPEPGTSGQRV